MRALKQSERLHTGCRCGWMATLEVRRAAAGDVVASIRRRDGKEAGEQDGLRRGGSALRSRWTGRMTAPAYGC